MSPFNGTKFGMFYSAEYGGLTLDSGDYIDNLADDNDWDALTSIDSIGGVIPSGEYEFDSTWNMGGTFDVNIKRDFVTFPYLPGGLWDDNLNDIDSWPEIDDDNLDRVNLSLYVRTTDTDPSVGVPVYTEWNEFANAIVRGWGFQFKVIATSDDSSINIIVNELNVSLELQQRIEQSAVLASGAAPYPVTFESKFYDEPNIVITASNMATGDFYLVSNLTRTGFTVEFKNNGGTTVNRSFNYVATGYGKEI